MFSHLQFPDQLSDRSLRCKSTAKTLPNVLNSVLCEILSEMPKIEY